MWDKWKDKIHNLIWKEVEVEEFQEIHEMHETHDPTQKVQAKMAYQYPEKKPFRFPVIPDQAEYKRPTELSDIPAYQRRKKTRIQAERVETERKDTENGSTNQTSRKKMPNNVPFKPSAVASPIYGYQERKRAKEVENTPAYIRKQRIEAEKESATTLEKDVQSTNTPLSEMEQSNMQWNKNGHQKDQQADLAIDKPEDISSTENNISDSQGSAHGTIEPFPINPEQRDNRQAARHKRNQERLQKNKRKTIPNQQSSGPSEPVPFNVMMTPRDKHRLAQQKKTQLNQVNTQKPNNRYPEVPQQANNIQSNGTSLRKLETVQQIEAVDHSLPLHLLDDVVPKNNANHLWVREQQTLLEKTLKYFNVRASVVNATQGPAVTRFEIQPEMGVKVSRIRNLSDDIKLNMSARDLRMEAPIPGKNTIGIEVPNPNPEMVGLQEIFESNAFKQSASPLSIALGLNIEGTPIISTIQKMPHGLIAGATGSGKSVCINTILVSLLYKASHEDVKFLLIDPKMVELAPYNGIPHLVSPVITDIKAATAALKWAVQEMESRYDRFVDEGVRDIERFNQKMKKQQRTDEKMPFIVIVIDELADLMMVSPQDVEDAICRIAQKARACGIHLLLATQRPSVDVITGLIKANIPTRIAFSVSSQVDSRTIIDTAGAEKLLGKGDMLFNENGAGKNVRIQGPFVSDDEIERITNYARQIAPPNYLFEQETLLAQIETDQEEDELLPDAIQFVVSNNGASTSLLQRHFKIGYNRAARLIDSLEAKGIIAGQNGSKPRDVLVTSAQLDEMQL